MFVEADVLGDQDASGLRVIGTVPSGGGVVAKEDAFPGASGPFGSGRGGVQDKCSASEYSQMCYIGSETRKLAVGSVASVGSSGGPIN